MRISPDVSIMVIYIEEKTPKVNQGQQHFLARTPLHFPARLW